MCSLFMKMLSRTEARSLTIKSIIILLYIYGFHFTSQNVRRPCNHEDF